MAAWEFQMLQNIAEKHGWHKFISMQNYYNLIYREEEREMIPYCKATGVGLIPWSPIARGALARPFGERGTLREKSDKFLKTMIRDPETETDKAVIDRVDEIAKKRGVSMTCVATAWCLTKDVCPIIGLSSKERIEEACANVKFASEGKLTKEDIEYLEDAYRPKKVSSRW
jgi:aryl-alcohol dehydrogenase-like predicted oxidoreductase